MLPLPELYLVMDTLEPMSKRKTVIEVGNFVIANDYVVGIFAYILIIINWWLLQRSLREYQRIRKIYIRRYARKTNGN